MNAVPTRTCLVREDEDLAEGKQSTSRSWWITGDGTVRH